LTGVEISNDIKRRRTFAIISHPDNSVADKPGQHATEKPKSPMIYEECCYPSRQARSSADKLRHAKHVQKHVQNFAFFGPLGDFGYLYMLEG
jgi:hypothetical protein